MMILFLRNLSSNTLIKKKNNLSFVTPTSFPNQMNIFFNFMNLENTLTINSLNTANHITPNI